jgi:signal transduction histidine kinase
LGLAIVRQIVLLHGGNVQIATSPGAGTTVTVLLPQSTAPGTSLTVSQPDEGESVI